MGYDGGLNISPLLPAGPNMYRAARLCFFLSSVLVFKLSLMSLYSSSFWDVLLFNIIGSFTASSFKKNTPL
jgi:hypothetical protein